MKHVIITGGSSGIGLALAEKYVKDGFSISLLARRKDVLDDAQKQLQSLCKEEKQEVLTFPCDLTNEQDTFQVIHQCIAYFERVDDLITSAGYSKPGYFLDQSTELFKKTFDVNVFGTLYAIKAVLPIMKRQGFGRITLISSGAALIGIFGSASYCASKFAVKGLAEVLRSECKPMGVQVSIAYPPDTDTPMMHNNKDLKPKETQMIMGSAGFFTVEKVADSIYKGINKGDFSITTGLSLKLLSRLGSLILPIINRSFDKKIQKAQYSN